MLHTASLNGGWALAAKQSGGPAVVAAALGVALAVAAVKLWDFRWVPTETLYWSSSSQHQEYPRIGARLAPVQNPCSKIMAFKQLVKYMLARKSMLEEALSFI
eukprot:scaffold245108_cov17-Tisochrysis_lutea.AAC.1